MQRIDNRKNTCPFNIVISENEVKTHSDDRKLPTSTSQTPLNESVILPKVSESIIADSFETDASVDSSPSINIDTQKRDPHIPIDIETMAILSSMLENEEYETGISNNSERYFERLLKENKLAAMNGISVLFMNNYSVGGRKENILTGILHILSHLEYESIYPQGQMIAISALSHANREVEEYGIKCFEDWGHRDGIEKLRAIKFNSDWLREYAEEVISELSAGE